MKSPCENICVIDPVSGFCVGCGRTGDEISKWVSYDDSQRENIMATLDMRKQQITMARPRGASNRMRRMRNSNG